MQSNNNHVTTALEHLDAVEATRTNLLELYKQARSIGHNDRIGQRIAEAHQAIGHGMKMASIHAQLAQAEAITAMQEILLKPALSHGVVAR